ncbi:MAG: hypothetical protein ACFFBD_06415 [Candidatus Hodarchaeota archaeon]
MYGIWDVKSDCVIKGDKLRDVSPILSKTRIDKNGFTHYVFSKSMFYNPRFIIPDNDYELFEKFLDGGSREYPSDGSIPADVIAAEANLVLDKITEIANKSNHKYCQIAREELRKNGRNGLVRGTVKLYLGEYTTRDWRRKRFTDDIDFWIFNKNLLEYTLRKTGWKKNSKTKEFEKTIKWYNYSTNKLESSVIIASNDTDQVLDFCNGCYLEGSTLNDIFKKKIKRGHDVDLSDIINVAIVNNRQQGELNVDWIDIWDVFEVSANIRSSRITSNMISLCRFSHGIADYLDRIGRAIHKYRKYVLEESKYSDKKIVHVCRVSSHHLKRSSTFKPNITRNRIYNNLAKQQNKKKQYAINLRNFANNVLRILNSKYQHLKVIFEIESLEKKIPKIILN